MAHEITEREDGTAEAAFSVLPAWHGLGTVFDHTMSSAEAITAAQLNWQVKQESLAYIRWENDHPKEVVPVPVLANLRSDNNEYLGTVTKSYQLVQNQEAFSFLDELIEEKKMEYEAAFSLNGGKKVVLLGRLPQEDTIVKKDRQLRYVLLSLSHDGTGAIRFGPTSVRVVCANTYSLALNEGTTEEIALRHTGNISDKLERARGILLKLQKKFDDYRDKAKLLTKHRMTKEEWKEYLEILCPTLNPKDPDYTVGRFKRLEVTRKAIEATYHNANNSIPGMEETPWAAFCAVTEHIDHLPRRGGNRKVRAEARFNVCLYGPGRDMKNRAFETAMRVAGVAQAT